MVVWQTDLSIAEAPPRCQLSDTSSYCPLDRGLTSDHQAITSQAINKLIISGDLPSIASNPIVPQPRTARFYLLPKIHKRDCPGRPIVSACSCPTELISSYLDSILSPLVQELPTYIRVAMGIRMVLRYACLFVGYVGQSLFHNYTSNIPHLFLRYIDDCIGAALCSRKELEQFINFTTTFCHALKFTWTISDASLPFLDFS
eukprot:g36139.t1